MKLTTLCYLEKGNQYLMLHRISKKNDPNKDKWIGIGGKFEGNESPEECLYREVKEETGYCLERYQFRGIITFVSDVWETEYMHLFTADQFYGEEKECKEGKLKWIEKKRVYELDLWEGDKIFLKLLQKKTEPFLLKLCYRGESLEKAVLDGKDLNIFHNTCH